MSLNNEKIDLITSLISKYAVIEYISNKEGINLDKPMCPGAFVDDSKIEELKSSLSNPVDDSRIDWLLKDGKKPDDVDTVTKMTSEKITSIEDKPDDKPEESNKTAPDDAKIMSEFICPFASSQIGDLANFYRDCYKAPMLETFSNDGSNNSIEASDNSVSDIAVQLENFEKSSREYDRMISDLSSSSDDT